MRNSSKIGTLSAAAIAFSAMLAATPAHAQATRTWVDGLGDDANPCSRTAPCKTFAGAISKTAAGGEINCAANDGGFGAVTITKAITISCTGLEAGVLVTGTNGIVVNAGANDVVILRGLDIVGLGPSTQSLNGIRFITGAALHVEDCIIRAFTSTNGTDGNGILFAPSAASKLYVERTVITDNGSGSVGGGIVIRPAGATGTATATISATTISNNGGAALKIDTTGNTATAGVNVSVDSSSLSGSQLGIGTVNPAATQSAQIMLARSTVFGNSAGVVANGGTIRVSATTISGNTTGVVAANGGAVKSYGDNLLDGNTNPGAFTAPNLAKN